MSLSLETLGLGDGAATAAARFFTTTYLEHTPPGRYRAKKLILLAHNLAQSSMEGKEALLGELCEIASREIANTHDAPLFRQLQSLRKENAANESERQAWLERVERENRVRRAQLEQSLAKAKSEGGKEGPRLACKDLGQFFVETGDGTNATRMLFQGKEFCTSNAAHLEMALAVMEASLEYGNYGYASTFALRAQQLSGKNEIQRAKLVLALCDLEQKRYKSCAKSLLLLTMSPAAAADQTPLLPLVSYEDIAQTAVICALATFTRMELKQLVLENQSFKPMLELVPVAKDLLLDFLGGRYGALVRRMNAARPVLDMDVLLAAPHGDFLGRQIFIQAVTQFLDPYSNVKLDKVSQHFELTLAQVEHEVAQLIAQGKVGNFRIDAQNKLLVRKREDEAQRAMRHALNASRDFAQTTRSMLLRATLLENSIVYNPHSSTTGTTGTTSTGGKRAGQGRKLMGLEAMLQGGGDAVMLDQSEEED